MEWTRRQRSRPRRPAIAVACLLAAVLLAGCSGRTTGATIITDTSARLNAVGSCDTTCQVFIRWRKAGTSAWRAWQAPKATVSRETRTVARRRRCMTSDAIGRTTWRHGARFSPRAGRRQDDAPKRGCPE